YVHPSLISISRKHFYLHSFPTRRSSDLFVSSRLIMSCAISVYTLLISSAVCLPFPSFSHLQFLHSIQHFLMEICIQKHCLVWASLAGLFIYSLSSSSSIQ